MAEYDNYDEDDYDEFQPTAEQSARWARERALEYTLRAIEAVNKSGHSWFPEDPAELAEKFRRYIEGEPEPTPVPEPTVDPGPQPVA